MRYDQKYHELVHKSIISDSENYFWKAMVSYYNYFSEKERELLKQNKLKILEFGCGMGQNIYLFHNSVGYDISEFARDFCNKKGIKTISKLEGKYDLILVCHVLEHLKDPLNTLIELKNHLTENGRIRIIIPKEPYETVDLEPDGSNHLYNWNLRNINNLLWEAGFRPIYNKEQIRPSGYKLNFIGKRFGEKSFNLMLKLVGLWKDSKEFKIDAIIRKPDYRFTLNDGTSWNSNINRTEFKKLLKKGVKIVKEEVC